MGNDYLRRLSEARDGGLLDGLEIGTQLMMDCICIALNDPETMGKDTFGSERLIRVMRKVGELHNVFRRTLTTDKEADYLQEQLDGRLREIFKDRATPFHKRYPQVLKINYSKAKKEWT